MALWRLSFVYDSFWVDHRSTPGPYPPNGAGSQRVLADVRYCRIGGCYLSETTPGPRKLEILGRLSKRRAVGKNGRTALESARQAVDRGDRARVEQIHKAQELSDSFDRGLPGDRGLSTSSTPRPTYALSTVDRGHRIGDNKLANAEVNRLARALNRAAAVLELGP